MAENAEGKIRVLIVDDIPETRENLRALLRFESDIEVVGVAANGETGIRMARELQPHIVLMDINMPGIDGITATEAITEEMPAICVIMISVQGEADYLRRSMLAGALEFLIKPFSSDEIVSSIRRVYELGASRRADLMPAIQSLEELQDIERLEVYNTNRALGRAMDRLEYMISEIPHDLKEPLGVARDILDQLSKISSPVIKEEIVYCKDRLDYALLRVNRLISVTSCGELEVRTKTSLTETLKLLLSLIKSNLQSSVPIDVDIKPENLEIQVKDSDLQQITLCLLENAIEATPEGGTVRVIAREQVSTDCHIKILDVGSGIKGPKALLYTLGHTTKPNHSGLGLFVCKKIVTQYGGKISVSPREDGQGAIASVVLPKEFKQRRRKYRLADLKKALRQYRNLSLNPQEEDTVRDITTRILAVFAANVSSVVEEVGSIMSSMLRQMPQHADEKQISLLQELLSNCARAWHAVRNLSELPQPVQIQPIHLSEDKAQSKATPKGQFPLAELSRLTDGIVHDIRSGLGVIRHTVGFLEDDLADSPHQSDLLKISRNLDFCELVLRNLSALGGQDIFQPQWVNLEAIVREVFFMLERKLVDVELVMDTAPDVLEILADGGQMKQVFMNLIKNAGEAMPDGGTLTVRIRREGRMLRVEVSDGGCGIPPENQERLFHEFFTTKERGYGLGLHIVYTIVKRYGGAIAVKSKVGEGTTFTLHLPIE